MQQTLPLLLAKKTNVVNGNMHGNMQQCRRGGGNNVTQASKLLHARVCMCTQQSPGSSFPPKACVQDTDTITPHPPTHPRQSC